MTAHVNQSRPVSGEGLSARELDVLHTVKRVRMASGEQLGRLHFADTSERQRRRGLTRLVTRRYLARLDRSIGGVRAGSSGYVYALDIEALRLLRTDPRRIQRPVTPGGAFLRHSIAVTELYIRLVERARGRQIDLLEFETEPRAWRSFAGRGGGRVTLKPDAFVRVTAGDFEDLWFLEVDLATESPATLDRKLDCYRAYWQSGREQARFGVFPRLLWTAPDERRHAVIVDACGRQPTEAWPLFMVTLFDDAADLITEGVA